MADFIWTGGAGDGNMNTAGNWAGAAAPSGTANVYFNQGSSSVTTWVTNNIASLNVTKGYSGNFGTSTTPVSIPNAITTMRIGGRGAIYNFAVATAITVTTCTLETVNAVISGAGTITTLNVAGGSTATVSITALTNVNVVGPDDVCDVATSATAITAANVTGRLTCTARDITTLVADASTSRVTMYGTSTTGAIVTGTFSSGAIFSKQSAATDTTITIKSGALLTNAGNLNQAATVTTLNRWTGSKADLIGPGNTLTVGTTTYVGPSSGPSDGA